MDFATTIPRRYGSGKVPVGMQPTTRVDFHCHSTYSDGTQPPQEVARQLAAEDVAVAALTDHDTVDGLPEFHRALAREGLGFITGVEITTRCEGQEAHLLGYGFDPNHPELQATLLALRQTQAPEVHSITGSLRLKGSPPPGDVAPAATNGQLDIAEAIALLHRAGGRAFLAHPLVLHTNPDDLRALLLRLKEQGLDGIEAVYGAFTPQQRELLVALAHETGLLVSAGSDRHERRSPDQPPLGMEMPTELWKQFRDNITAGGAAVAMPPASHPRLRLKRRHFFFHVVFPTLLALGLFAVAMFGVFLPTFQRSLLERKREMIRELTTSAWSILDEYHRDEKAGTLTRSEAQQLARARIEGLRYGREGKDYFWLQDMKPRIIMHPYRKDLNGEDVSGFRDARGTRIFVEFAELVRRQRDGYIAYYWQWKDDPSRVVPKESYIKGFLPWGWIIGTGIYLDDVKSEIDRVQRNLLHTLLAISALVALLLAYVMRQALRLERARSDTEESLRESTERYRSLVEATTEGTLLVLDGRCRYANPIFLEMVGHSEQELSLLDLADLLPDVTGNEAAWACVKRVLAGQPSPEGCEGLLRRRDGVLLDAVFSISPIVFAGRQGCILMATDLSRQGDALQSGASRQGQRLHDLQDLADRVPTGLFRARATVRGTIVDCNPAAARLLRPDPSEDGIATLSLASLFPDGTVYEEFLQALRREGTLERRLHVATEDPGTRILRLRATVVPDDKGNPRYVDGVLDDVTVEDRQAAERDTLIERLQTSLLFLHEPVAPLSDAAVFCGLQTPLRTVAAMMSAQHVSAALVRADSGEVVGIVTDHDLRERALATGVDPSAPVHRIMTAPLTTIPEHAEVYEALLVMEEKGVQHLAVEDEAGRIVGVVRNQELLQFQSYGSIVLTREIAHAPAAQQVIASCRRAPGLAKALIDCGARPDRVTRMLSSVCDAATQRFVALAQEELGPPPVSFVFIALGSQGREEQTLSSDQDNAIIYAPREDVSDESASEYLLAVGTRVCGWLNDAGYPYCRGDVMAQTPRYCQPLSVWKQYFSEWVRRAEPKQLLEFSIFFDFRPVCGDTELVHELRRHVHAEVRQTPAFLPHFAQNSLLFKPPLRLFGRLVGGGDQPGQLNLKDAVLPLVNFARLYTLRQGLADTHTLDRLDALQRQGVILELSRDETAAAYDFLMGLRLRQQSQALQAGQTPDNLIRQRRLTQLEETQITQSFAQIVAIQKRISQEFLGGS